MLPTFVWKTRCFKLIRAGRNVLLPPNFQADGQMPGLSFHENLQMEILIKVGQLILSLSILIVLHELGHFLPAKWFKTRVEKFYLFFDPYFELFKKKIGETEYGIGWLPLGGYVKIAGMIDESFDTEQMKGEPEPWEFRSKPAWQRLIIMLGGVTVNFFLGFFIYAMIFWTYGTEFLPTDNLTYGVSPDSLGKVMGIQQGDLLRSVGTYEMEKFEPNQLKLKIIIDGVREFEVERDGKRVKLPVSEEMAEALSKYENKGFRLASVPVPFEISRFAEQCEGAFFWKKCTEAPSQAAGMEVGDRIIALNGEVTPYFGDFYDKLKGGDFKAKEVTVTAIRNKGGSRNDTLNFKITTTAGGLIGAAPDGNLSKYYKTETQSYTLGQAIPAGIKKGWSFLTGQITAFGKMFSGDIKVNDSLGSFLTIGSMFPGTWNWEIFWGMTAMLSLILAFINLLPIPALDGGHVMFLLWEVLTGKKPSDKVMEVSTMVGFVLLIGVMVYALGLDISRLF